MKPHHERLLVATLAGMIIVSAAAFAITPASAAGYNVDQKAQVTGVAWWDQLNIRKWPAAYSKKTGALKPKTWVWVERCVKVENASDWCKVERNHQQGWVNARYLTLHNPYTD
ncbi:SH3 domain-containing protein [Mariluticola halotolerans]|uniref:SH3 domain-containing protein n=1 Tax=Mariluticola halotolerans TaxID=2909283 RepID=UPI0026E212B8|nr:hypothetical protein [Mariluticola halotolerans]UJQ95775.1 hypothetical protein L1P08_07260 [Mariluticola halotolerans]